MKFVVPDPAWGLTTLPNPLVGWGGDIPPYSSADASGVSLSTPFALRTVPLQVGRLSPSFNGGWKALNWISSNIIKRTVRLESSFSAAPNTISLRGAIPKFQEQ